MGGGAILPKYRAGSAISIHSSHIFLGFRSVGYEAPVFKPIFNFDFN
jgi:hypothetical protein